MQLNCDLGEDFGAWTMSVEPAIMEVIDQANIACGFVVSTFSSRWRLNDWRDGFI